MSIIIAVVVIYLFIGFVLGFYLSINTVNTWDWKEIRGVAYMSVMWLPMLIQQLSRK